MKRQIKKTRSANLRVAGWSKPRLGHMDACADSPKKGGPFFRRCALLDEEEHAETLPTEGLSIVGLEVFRRELLHLHLRG
jgi:hypothetical protein